MVVIQAQDDDCLVCGIAEEIDLREILEVKPPGLMMCRDRGEG